MCIMDYKHKKVQKKTVFAKITNAIPLLKQNQPAWLDTTSRHYKNCHDFNTFVSYKSVHNT